MFSDEVFDILERAGLLRGNDKLAYLKANAGNDGLKNAVYAAYNPMITYGLANLPPAGNGTAQFGPQEYVLLRTLADRSISGNLAREQVASSLERLTPKSGELLRRIITKDLRAGFDARTANRVWLGLIPEFNVALAQAFDEKSWKNGMRLVSPKLDGMRCIAVATSGEVEFYSRNGKPITAVDHLKPQVRQLAAFMGGTAVLDGELMSSTFLDTISNTRRKEQGSEEVCLHVFDHLTVQEFSDKECSRPLHHRLKYLEEVFGGMNLAGVLLVGHEWATNPDHALQITQGYWDAGFEGAIVKVADEPYAFKRSKGWQKIKKYDSVDVRVIDLVEGTGKYAGMLGALVVDVDGVKVNVGSGISDEDRAAIWTNPASVLNSVVEVGFHERTPDGSLRHPRLVKARPDKEAA